LIPSKQLRDLLKEPFSANKLALLERALSTFTPLSVGGTVAVYVIRKVCLDLCGHMEATEPVTSTRHAAIAGYVDEPIAVAIRSLVDKQDVPIEELHSVIKASETVRHLT
jgi:hypothetical protein